MTQQEENDMLMEDIERLQHTVTMMMEGVAKIQEVTEPGEPAHEIAKETLIGLMEMAEIAIAKLSDFEPDDED